MMRAAAVLLLLTAALASCATATDDDSVLVMAAASLTDAFSEMATAFEAANPSIDIQLNLAGSGSLREQILQGAPAGVFASANQQTMSIVIDEGEAAGARPFATNELVVAIPLDNPGAVDALTDLADPDRLIGLCSVGVPCGSFARDALNQLGVVASVDTNERDVRALLTKIEVGELDAGIVYATDAVASDEVVALDLLAEAAVDISYPIAVLNAAPNPDAAQAFVDFVLSPAGQAILDSHGFGAP